MIVEAEIKAPSEQTRTRLLDAAREVFSQQGFQGATVREICRRAEANVAAVNYHFGSKDGLLAETLNFTQLKAMQLANIKASDCPKMRLHLFIRDFMLMLLDEKTPSSQCRIMARELADPSPALDKIVHEAIAPLHKFLGELVREIVGEQTNKHGKNDVPNDETCRARFPEETTGHSTRLQTTSAKSLVIPHEAPLSNSLPQAGERTNVKSNLEFSGEGANESLREFHVNEAELRRCVHSILGQCLFYRHSHPVLQRLHPKLRYDHKEIEAIAGHIADFSLEGIKYLAKKSG